MAPSFALQTGKEDAMRLDQNRILCKCGKRQRIRQETVKSRKERHRETASLAGIRVTCAFFCE